MTSDTTASMHSDSVEGDPATSAGPPGDPTIVLVEHLAKTYRLGAFHKTIRAAYDITFDIRRGETFGLLGPNGAGKTTTMKVLMGLVKPSRGKVQMFGQPLGSTSVKARVGYLPESPYFYDYLTGRELLVFIGHLFGLRRKDARRRAGALLEQVGLERSADVALRRYSKGMLQRIGLAQALINDPELVVLDEPLTGLDPIWRKRLRELVRELSKAGKTIMLSSHVLSDVEALADRVAIVIQGRTVDVGPLSRIVDTKVLNIEVTIEGDASLAARLEQAGYSLTRYPDTLHVLLAEQTALDPLIDEVRAGQGRLVAVTPRKESLEDVVVGWASQSAEQAKGAGDLPRAEAAG